MVAGHQFQAPLSRRQCSVPVAKVAAQLAQMQPDPRVVRLLQSALFCVAESLLQLSAVGQSDREAVVPGAAAGGILLRIPHPLDAPVVEFILADIHAGIAVPQCNLQVLPCLFFCKAIFLHTVFDEGCQIAQDPVEVSALLI